MDPYSRSHGTNLDLSIFGDTPLLLSSLLYLYWTHARFELASDPSKGFQKFLTLLETQLVILDADAILHVCHGTDGMANSFRVCHGNRVEYHFECDGWQCQINIEMKRILEDKDLFIFRGREARQERERQNQQNVVPSTVEE
jgi:hypothetical protein